MLQAGGLNLSAYEVASGSSARGVEGDADESQGRSWQERHNDGGRHKVVVPFTTSLRDDNINL